MGKACFFRNAVRAETVPQFTRPWGLTMKIIRLVKMSYCVHLVGYGAVRVQVRVSGAVVVVVEPGNRQPLSAHLDRPVAALTGETSLLFDPLQRLRDGFTVSALDLCPPGIISDFPQRSDRLYWG